MLFRKQSSSPDDQQVNNKRNPYYYYNIMTIHREQTLFYVQPNPRLHHRLLARDYAAFTHSEAPAHAIPAVWPTEIAVMTTRLYVSAL